MIIDNLSQIQAVEISRGIYGTKTCFMDFPSFLPAAKRQVKWKCRSKKEGLMGDLWVLWGFSHCYLVFLVFLLILLHILSFSLFDG